MTPETKARIRLAVELRAAGATWEAVGQRLGRDSSTCRRWPSRYRAEWDEFQVAAGEKTGSLQLLCRPVAPAGGDRRAARAMPGHDLGLALRRALRERLAATPIPPQRSTSAAQHSNRPAATRKPSAAATPDLENAVEMRRGADEALYRAKKSGRRRVKRAELGRPP